MIRDAKGRLGVEESRVCCARRGACADSWPQELADDILATLFLFAVAAMYAYSSIPVEISGIYFVAIAITFERTHSINRLLAMARVEHRKACFI